MTLTFKKFFWFVVGVGKGKKKNGMLDYTANHDYISNLQKNSKI